MRVDPDTGEVIGVFLRTPYNYDMNAASDASALVCHEATLAQQQFAEECDINTIVRRFGLTGQLPTDVRIPMTGDFTDMVTDYRSALEQVMEAQEAFMKMPADVRRRFDNDPHRFIEFVEKKENFDEAKRLGLINLPGEPPAPMLVKVVADKPQDQSST